MKNRFRIALAGATCLFVAAIAMAATVYNAYLVNQTVTASQNFTLNLNTTPNASGITHVSAQAVYSSATIPAATFTDGRLSTATITVVSNSGLVAAPAVNTITIAADSVIQSSAAFDNITVSTTGGLTNAYLTLNGTTIRNTGWTTSTVAAVAISIANQINSTVYQVIASTNGASGISLRARSAGANGNTYTISSSTPAAISVGSAHFHGGKDPAFFNAYLTVNGVKYSRGYYWNQAANGVETSTGTAASISTLLNTIQGIKANAVASVVYTTATASGTAGNAFTIVSSTPNAMTVASLHYTGGMGNAVITINGVPLTQGTDWNVGGSVSLTATAIKNAINANSSLSPIVVAASAAGVISTTSTAVGVLSNYTLTSSTPAAISVSHPTYVGGQNASYAINSPTIFIPSNGFPTGLPVLLTGSTPPSPLVAGTTYYTISVDASDIQLATTSARAFAGQYATITSSTTTGPHTFTLTPLGYSGTIGMAWYGSNDGTNYNPVNVSSVTATATSTPVASLWDFGRINYTYLQLQVTGPTTGGVVLTVKVNGKN